MLAYPAVVTSTEVGAAMLEPYISGPGVTNAATTAAIAGVTAPETATSERSGD